MDRANVYSDTAAEGQKASALYLPGAANNFVSAPDSAGLSVTGDLDLRLKCRTTSAATGAIQGLIVKMPTVGQYTYTFRINTDGKLRLSWSGDGTATSAALGPSVVSLDGADVWLRATLDIDNGAGRSEVRFYSSTDGASWTQRGSTMTVAGGPAALFDGTAVTEIGAVNGASNYAGLLYRAEIRNGIDGPIVAQWDGRIPATRQRDPQGNIWTVNGTANGWVTV